MRMASILVARGIYVWGGGHSRLGGGGGESQVSRPLYQSLPNESDRSISVDL